MRLMVRIVSKLLLCKNQVVDKMVSAVRMKVLNEMVGNLVKLNNLIPLTDKD
jgi:hypothetical protein